MFHAKVQLRAAICVACVALWAGTELPAQVDKEPPLYEQEPFDVLVLTPAHKKARVAIYPTQFPNRRFERRSGTPLRIRMQAYPDRQFDVRWSDIDTVVVYEDLLLEAAQKKIAAGDLLSAYRHLERLADEDTDWPGIDEALAKLMRADAVDSFRKGRTILALGTLDFLFTADPSAASTTSALAAVGDRLFKQELSRKRYVQARQMIRHFENRYGPRRTGEYVSAWKEKLRQLSDDYLALARELESDPRAALEQIELARKLWPDSAQVAELAAQLARQHPRVVVGVTRAAAADSYWNEWTARRVGRLRARRMMEIVGVDSDGARYQGLLGRLESRDSGQAVAYQLDPQRASGATLDVSQFDLAGRVLGSLDPAQSDYFPLWHRVIDAIDVSPASGIVISFKQPLLRTASFLTWQMSDPPAEPHTGRNQVWNGLIPYTNTLPGRYDLNPEYALRQPGQPVEIVERTYASGSALADALRAGDVHVADRLTPMDRELLTELPGVITRQYLFPSVHFLLPNATSDSRRRLVDDRNYRRALTFAINRRAILEQDLLGGRAVPGCQQISGPFPPGMGADDPLAYAYDDDILPRDYDPSLGVTLARLAETDFARQVEQPEPAAAPPPLVLAHPDDPICTSACLAIAGYLNAAKIQCKTLQLPTGQVVPDASTNWDLLYVDTVLSEPLTDVHRLFGVGGLMTKTSPYLQSSLGRLAKATVWSEARAILRDIHRLTHDELTVIPLWQWIDYYAYRDYVSGVTRDAVTLYQDIENWNVHPENAR